MSRNILTGGGGGGGGGGATVPSPGGTFQVLGSTDGVNWTSVSLTEDWVSAGFSPSLSFSAGGTSPLKLGTSFSPTFTSNPLPNAAGVTAFTISDSQGGGPVSRLGSGSGFQGPSVSYTNSPTTSPQTITFTISVTKSGVTKSATASVVEADEVWTGVGTAGATGLNGSTGALVGATGTLAATVSSSGKVSASYSPTNQKLYYVGPSSLTFKDANNLTVPMTSSTISVTNSNSVTTTRTLYESVNLLSSVANPVTPS
ncbi:MAG TPA: hypothetical protein VI159_01535 [Gemmatimonadales bacterium]